MNKIIMCALSLLFGFSLAAFSKTYKNAAAAEVENPNIIITTNYNQEGLLTFEPFDSSGSIEGGMFFSHEFDLEISRYYADITKINISINENLLNDYLGFNGVTGISVVGGSATEAGNGVYVVTIDNWEELTAIVITFDVESFEIIPEYFELGNVINGSLDKDFIEFYTVKNNVETKLEKIDGKYWVQYNQFLRIKISENITFDNGKTSYDFDSLYFNVRHEQMLAGKQPTCVQYDTGKFECEIDSAFLYDYYFFGNIKLLCYFTQSFKFSLEFDNPNLAVDYQVKNIDTGAAVTENQFLKSGTNLQVTMKLLDYTQLAKLTDGRYDISGLNYTLDKVSESADKDVTIDVIVFDRNINLKIYLEFVTFYIEGLNEHVTFNQRTFKMGDKIEITALVDNSSFEVKAWKINGMEVPKLNQTENGMKRIAVNVVEIDMSAWYEICKASGTAFNVFKNEVITGMKTSMILAITIPIGAAFLAAIILLIIMLLHFKTKKKIRALLEAEKQASYIFNASSMIDDLREDSFMKVSEDEIKAKMKKHKKHIDESEDNDI